MPGLSTGPGKREGGITVTDEQILQALKRLRVETGSLACLGCGREHNCGTHGCAILRKAADLIERLSGEVEDLRRKLAMSDKDVTAAHLHFSQWQAAFNQLTQTVSRIEDEDKTGKLCAAIRAQLAAWGKTMEGTA
nr:MAG TPA: hypothetical protein [Bacteriophage sp.]